MLDDPSRLVHMTMQHSDCLPRRCRGLVHTSSFIPSQALIDVGSIWVNRLKLVLAVSHSAQSYNASLAHYGPRLRQPTTDRLSGII